ncbi:YncE family protein [Rhodococcus sp. CX]|uniref:YncE family protein n=1 Tax=Rhodococcus sp. CX TaxID=2789880 RepID=UPI0018CDEFCB|nr:YncE family protein [Rhodococcus sp. CX]MBH0121236.1 YncE family protein [Rhodococcus sp. CX]
MRPHQDVATLLGLIAVLALGCSSTVPSESPQTGDLPLRQVAQTELTGGPARFDYTSLDPALGLMFIAHMGAGEIIDVDVHGRRVVRTITDVPDVHGVLVVPDIRRVYATVTGRDQLVAFDEDTGEVLFAAPTGDYPDGLAYDPVRHAVWTTDEHAGTETVVDADSGAVRATVDLGGEVGNVVYDPAIDRMVVAVQGRGHLAVIDPAGFTVTDRIPTPGCDGPHGEALDAADQVMFVGCETGAAMATVDLAARTVTSQDPVGDTPDVLVYDPGAHRVYVAAESGVVSVFDRRDNNTVTVGAAHLADGAHTLALDPATHHTYFPIPKGAGDGPVLYEFEPTT